MVPEAAEGISFPTERVIFGHARQVLLSLALVFHFGASHLQKALLAAGICILARTFNLVETACRYCVYLVFRVMYDTHCYPNRFHS